MNGGSARGGTILLVEDEEDIATLVRTYLEKDGFRVIWAARGAEAFAALDRTRSGSRSSTSSFPTPTASTSAAPSAPPRACRS